MNASCYTISEIIFVSHNYIITRAFATFLKQNNTSTYFIKIAAPSNYALKTFLTVQIFQLNQISVSITVVSKVNSRFQI